MKKSKINILIVDDSVVIQKLLTRYLTKETDFNIVSICSDPFQASQVLSENEVDCMLLDLELPKMDGITFLKKLNQSYSVKTIILSTLVSSNTEMKSKLKNLGAFDAFSKPSQSSNESFFATLFAAIRKTKTTDNLASPLFNKNSNLLLIASSTGSTDSVKKILVALKDNPPTTIVIQHMAAEFTTKFAKSLNLVSKFDVLEAGNNLSLENHAAYIAPGNFHLNVIKHLNQYHFELSQEDTMHGVRPAADHTLFNLPEDLAKNTTVVVLSGMGKDGAAGLARLKKLGAHTIAESEKSCVVFGMPKAAIETGKVDKVLSLNEIVDYLANYYNNKTSAA